jgi:threonine synthase
VGQGRHAEPEPVVQGPCRRGAAARAPSLGIDTLACASTGNLAGATAAGAAAAGLPAFVFLPASVEPAKIEHALAYGATVVPIDGTYDDVNRLCIEVADELGWGFVNVNLRPFYAEGSKTLAFEIAEGLGWRLPDVIVAPIASGRMFAKLAKGLRELVEVGLIEPRPVRFVGGQPAGCAPVASAWATQTEVEPVRRRTRSSTRWRSAAQPMAGTRSRSPVRAVGRSRRSTISRPQGDPRPGGPRGHLRRARGRRDAGRGRRGPSRGVIRDGDEVVVARDRQRAQDPRRSVIRARGASREPGRPGLAPVIPPSFSAFERWLQA